MTRNLRIASYKVSRVLYRIVIPVLLLLMCGQVNAQTVKAVINSAGGTNTSDGIKIEIYSDGGIKVTRNGLTESYSHTDSTIGLRAMFDFKNNTHFDGANLKSPSICYISPVSGTGSSADPYRVQIVGTILDKYYGGAGQTGTVTCIVSYIQNSNYFFMDFVMHMPNISGGTSAIFYLSEQSLMGAASAADPDEVSKCGYGFVSADGKTVGILRDVPCAGATEAPRSHVYRTYNQFDSWEASIPENRFYVDDDGYFPGNVVATGVDGRGRSLAVMHQLGALYRDAFSPDPVNVKTFRVLSGYGTTATEFDGITAVKDSFPVSGFSYNNGTGLYSPVKVQFTSAALSGNEGNTADGEQVAQGLTLNVSGGKLGAPTYVLVQYDASASFAHPAVLNTDFKLVQEEVLIPAGDYTTAKNIAISNLHVIGNDQLQYSRSLHLKLAGTCASLLTINGTSECDYTIIDDEPRSMVLNMDSTQILEGNSTKARIKLPSGVTFPEDITVTFSTLASSTVGDSDYVVPTSIIIPANAPSSPDFIIQGKSDKCLENTEKLTLKFQGTILGITVTGQSDLLILDSTYYNPNYSKILADCVSPDTARPVPEGYSGKLSFHLPPGVTTEVPINIKSIVVDNASTAEEGLDWNLDLYSGKVYTILAGTTSTEVTFDVVADKLLEGPTPEVIKLVVVALDNVGAKRSYTYAGPDIPIRDVDYNPNMKLVVAPATLKEGKSGSLTLTLPGGISAGYAIPVNVSRGLSSKATTADVSGLTSAANVTFTTTGTAKKTVTVTTLTAILDNVLENDENLWIVFKPTGFATDSGTVIIQDSTGLVPGNKDMNVSLVTPTLSEGNNTGIKINFVNSAISAEDPIAITLTHNAASIAATTDYNLASSTITLPSLTNSYTVNSALSAVTDGILEADEAFTLQASSTSIPGLNIPSFGGTIQDATGTNPANKIITVTPSTTIMNEGGTSYSFTYSLPAGITTEVPIVITPSLIAASTASAGDYTLDSTTLTLDKTNNHSNTTAVTIIDDGVTEGDESLILGGTAASPAITGVVVNQGATVTIKDKVVSTSLIITSDLSTIVEGGAGASVTIKLSGGATTSVPLSITASRGLSSGATSGYSGLPQTVSLVGNSITLAQISASVDNIVGDDETLVVYIDAAGYPKDSITLQIKDATAISNRKITFTPQPTTQGSHVLEGNTYTVRASFPAGILPATPVQLSVTSSVLSAAASSDYTGIPVVVTIDPSIGYQDFTFTANTDNFLESAELLRITGTVTNMTSVTTDSLNVFIDDATILDPAKAKLKITIDSTSIHKGSFSKVTIGYADATVISTQDLSINVAPDPSSTADITNYNGIPTVVTLPKDSNFVTFFLNIPDNFKIEGTTILQFAASATGYTVAPIAPINILDKPGAAIKLSKLTDPAEPATDGAFVVKLPITSATDVTVTLQVTYAGTNIQAVATTVVIPAGQDSVIVPVLIQDDQIIQGNLPLTVKLVKAISGGTNMIVDAATITLTVTDDESASTGPKAIARQILVEKVVDATQPTIEGAFMVRFNDTTVIAAQPISVNYNIGGTATAGTDYVGLSGNVVIPAGSYGTLVKIIPSGITYAGPSQTVQLQLSSASSTTPGVVWSFVAVPQATLTIYNNNIDTPAINLFTSTSVVTEGDEVSFIVRATKAAKADMPITIVATCDAFRTLTLGGGVVKGDTLIVTMLAGQKERTITVKINDNDVSDDDGFIQVSTKAYVNGSGTPAYTLGLAAEVKNAVIDNDSMKISFASSRYIAKVDFDTVGQPLPFLLRLNRPSSRIVTLYYEFFTPAAGELPAGTLAAVGGKDYDNAVTPLLILPGQSTSEVPVFVNGVERNKMFGMRLLRATVPSDQHVPVIDSVISASGIIEICMDCDADGDGVPDYIERFITDGRWEDNNKGEIRVHPAISPNNDGLGNDALYIENIDKFPDNDIIIFNRWGGTIFTTKGYNNVTNNFKGRANAGGGKNKDVLDGSYFYIIHYTDGSGNKKRYTGYLVIKR
ncbi:gliding motility-associated C-terminal domain-containing protein [Chitinophaga sp. CF118]|uniref:gliding motility-associated C-terminal domain-containing protein n=1 Tax=Chitinophaga sp. CF118 TaxID=1884367 RepID=UPI0015A50D41|nr:gliding motility-associated C-terminal domain-containing protein [Chitinophaga sp. CF118]